jgi:hypothetical protein
LFHSAEHYSPRFYLVSSQSLLIERQSRGESAKRAVEEILEIQAVVLYGFLIDDREWDRLERSGGAVGGAAERRVDVALEYRFGREADGGPAPAWGWDDVWL